ncbi:MAG: ribonuclease Y, partial [Chloroflexales bacterium]
MIELFWAALGLVVGLGVGGGVGVWWVNNGVNAQAQQKAAEARLLLEEARSQQKEILLQAK